MASQVRRLRRPSGSAGASVAGPPGCAAASQQADTSIRLTCLRSGALAASAVCSVSTVTASGGLLACRAFDDDDARGLSPWTPHCLHQTAQQK